MEYQSEIERRLGETAEQFFASFHPHPIDRTSLFNDNRLLSNEEAAELVSAVCNEFQVDEATFYEAFPFPHLFEVETSPLFLPFTLAKSIFGGGKSPSLHEEYTIGQFAALMDEKLL